MVKFFKMAVFKVMDTDYDIKDMGYAMEMEDMMAYCDKNGAFGVWAVLVWTGSGGG
jgi:hypothetical protein